MSNNDSGKFFVGSVIVFLVLFSIVKIILSTSQQAQKEITAPASMEAVDVAARIQPVGEVTIGEPPVIEAPAIEMDDSTGPGEQIVTAVCAACHGAGLMSAPRLGNASDWAPRIEKGMDTLHDHAINGFNMMPAKGGRADLSDEDIMAAVDYMVSQAQ